MSRLKAIVAFIGIALDIQDVQALIKRAFQAGGLAGASVAVWNWLANSVPTLSLVLIGASLFALLLSLLPTITNRMGNRWFPKGSVRTTGHAQDSRIEDQLRRISSRIKGIPVRWDFTQLRHSEPIVRLDLLIINTAMYDIYVEFKGHIRINSDPCSMDWRAGREVVPAGMALERQVLQPVTPATAERLRTAVANKEKVSFGVNEFRMKVKYAGPPLAGIDKELTEFEGEAVFKPDHYQLVPDNMYFQVMGGQISFPP